MASLHESTQKAVATAKELEELAEEHGIPVVEPFEGLESGDGILRVLGPSEEFYEDLLTLIADKEGATFREQLSRLSQMALQAIREAWSGPEELVEPKENATSPRNQTSTIVLAELDDSRFLFTGDAGVEALMRAVDAGGGDLGLTHCQIPHHGSKRNVGPSILDGLLGPRLEEGTTSGKVVSISCAEKGEPKHPSRRVTNAAIRRGARVFATKGMGLCHRSASPCRAGWRTATPEKFTEDFDD